MTRTGLFIITIATALATTGCGMSAPTAPSPSTAVSTSLFESID